MKPEENICICNRVPLCKLKNFIIRENPAVASQLSDCLGAGTSCGWCVPFLEKVHRQYVSGEPMQLKVRFEQYTERRSAYKSKKSSPKREE